jgi:hypothetical protein
MRQLLSAAGFEIVSVRGTHTYPRTIGGFIRKWIWQVFGVVAGFLLRARHGGAGEENVETFSVKPDLFAVARKPLSASAPPV